MLTLKGRWGSRNFLLWSRPTSLTHDDARCVGEFRTTFRAIPAFVRLVLNPNPSIDGVAAGVSVNVWNAKRHFLERVCGTILLWTS
jgi:hypothetical protein